jgi:hypothetical protein
LPHEPPVRLNRLSADSHQVSSTGVDAGRRGTMSEPFIVEIWGELAGIVLKDGNAFRFQAIARPFFALDGAHFTTPGHARLAAARLPSTRSSEHKP